MRFHAIFDIYRSYMRKSSRPVICAASLMPSWVGELNAISLNDRKLPKMKWLRSVVIIFDAMPKRRQFGATQIRDMPHLKVRSSLWLFGSFQMFNVL